MANRAAWHQSVTGKLIVQCATLKVTFVPITGSGPLEMHPLYGTGSRQPRGSENVLDLFLTLWLISCLNVAFL